MEGTAGGRRWVDGNTVLVGTGVMAGGGRTPGPDMGSEKAPRAVGEALSERWGGLSVHLRPSAGRNCVPGGGT